MAGTRIVWNGPKIKSVVDAAQRQAITATVADAAAYAQDIAPVDTGALKNSIRFDPAKKRGNGWVGSISSNMEYSLFVELGTRKMSPRPHIRPAADRIFPSLPDRIKELGG